MEDTSPSGDCSKMKMFGRENEEGNRLKGQRQGILFMETRVWYSPLSVRDSIPSVLWKEKLVWRRAVCQVVLWAGAIVCENKDHTDSGFGQSRKVRNYTEELRDGEKLKGHGPGELF